MDTKFGDCTKYSCILVTPWFSSSERGCQFSLAAKYYTHVLPTQVFLCFGCILSCEL